MKLNLSIIIATFNSEKTLKGTLESLLNQTNKNFEIIIIDGLSNDQTINIIKSYENNFSIHNIPYFWSSEKDLGIYDAWNKGLKKTNNQWIAFLGSDDCYYPNALENYANAIKTVENINYISSIVEVIDSDQKIMKIIGKPYKFSQMNRFMTIAHVGSFHHISLFEKHGNFNINYKVAGDYEFFIRSGKDIMAGFLKATTAKMLNAGVSNKLVNTAIKENLKIHLKYKRLTVVQCYFEFFLAHFKYFVRSNGLKLNKN